MTLPGGIISESMAMALIFEEKPATNFALSNFTPAGAVSISGYVGLFEWHVVQRSFRIAWKSSYVTFFS